MINVSKCFCLIVALYMLIPAFAYAERPLEDASYKSKEFCVTISSQEGWQTINVPSEFRTISTISGSWNVYYSHQQVGPEGYKGALEKRMHRQYKKHKYVKTVPFAALLMKDAEAGEIVWVKQTPHAFNGQKLQFRINDNDDVLSDNRGALKLCFGHYFPRLKKMTLSTDAVWHTLNKKCSDLREYTKNQGGGIRVTEQEFIKFLQKVEERNPGKSWKQILAALHGVAYGDDLDRTLPMTNIPLFNQGADTDGWKEVDLVCGVSINGKFKPNPPKFVYTDNGKMVDIAHAYAGLRSDLNRSVPGWTAFLRGANTYLGDMWQVLTDSPSKYPMWQLRGNLLGLWLSNYYSQSTNQDKPLSVAFTQFLKTH